MMKKIENINMEKKPPAVYIEGVDFHENDFVFQNKTWKIATLLKAAKEQGCEEFDLPLSALDLAVIPFEINSIDDFVFQASRIQKCNPNYPIILNWTGYICDGWHRVVKAIIEGKSTVKAIRLKKYVEPDYVDKKEEDADG